MPTVTLDCTGEELVTQLTESEEQPTSSSIPEHTYADDEEMARALQREFDREVRRGKYS